MSRVVMPSSYAGRISARGLDALLEYLAATAD
jgi:hypothetical protein